MANPGDPLVLGLPLIALAAIALGLQLAAGVHANSGGSPLTVLLAVSGIGLVLATAWSAWRRRARGSSSDAAGTSLPTTVLGVLAAFFLSYATIVLGLGHGWLTGAARETHHTVVLYLVSWIVLFALIGLASVRLPATMTTLLASFTAAPTLLLVGTLGPSPVAGRLAGIVVLLIGAGAGVLFLTVAWRGGAKLTARRPGLPSAPPRYRAD